MRSTTLGALIFAMAFGVCGSMAVAKPTAEQCRASNKHGYELGRTGGALKGSAEKEAKQCLDLGIEFNKEEFLRGARAGHEEFCTEELGLAHRGNRILAKRACLAFDNPYSRAYQGARSAGTSEDVRANLINDIAFARNGPNELVKSDVSDFSNALTIERFFENRVVFLEKEINDESLIPTTVNSPGPEYRPGKTTSELVSGIFKLSNWKSTGDAAMTIRKKQCKKGKWRDYGYNHGSFGQEAEIGLTEARAKCAKSKRPVDEQSYLEGHAEGLLNYCGYERGFHTIIESGEVKSACDKVLHPTYYKGLAHGEIRKEYIDLKNDAESDRSFVFQMIRTLNEKRARESVTPLVAASRKRLAAYLVEERFRLDALLDKISSHQLTTPELYRGIGGTGILPRPDSELDYRIPD